MDAFYQFVYSVDNGYDIRDEYNNIIMTVLDEQVVQGHQSQWDSKKFSFLSPFGQIADGVSVTSGAYGGWKEALMSSRNGWRTGYTAPVILWNKLSQVAGKAATAGGAISLAVDAVDVAKGNMSGGRFSYHAISFGTSTYVGATMGGPYGVAIALAFTGLELGYDKVVEPYVIRPAARTFDAGFDVFLRNYFQMPGY